MDNLKNHVDSIRGNSSVPSQNNSFVVFPNYFDKMVDCAYEDVRYNQDEEGNPERLFAGIEEYNKKFAAMDEASKSKVE